LEEDVPHTATDGYYGKGHFAESVCALRKREIRHAGLYDWRNARSLGGYDATSSMVEVVLKRWEDLLMYMTELKACSPSPIWQLDGKFWAERVK